MIFWIVVTIIVILWITYTILKARSEAMAKELQQKTGGWWSCNLLGTKCWYIPFDNIKVATDEKTQDDKDANKG